jgi:uncharacterized protein YkwD
LRSPTRGWVNARVDGGFGRAPRFLLVVIASIALVAIMIAAGPVNARRARHAAPSARSSSASGFLRAVLRVQNFERRRQGLGSLGDRGALDRAARCHVRDMVRRRYFGHVSPTGSDPLHRALGAGYGDLRTARVGENLLSWSTQLTAAEVVRKWMASPPHRQNILSRRWSDVGIAMMRHATSGGRGLTVAVEFGHRR